MSLGWLWAVWVAAFVVLEAAGQWHADDAAQPFTFYVREVMAYSWFFRGAVLLGIAWLFAHFAVGLP